MTREQIDSKLAEHAANGDRNAATLLAIRQEQIKLGGTRHQEWLRRTGQAHK